MPAFLATTRVQRLALAVLTTASLTTHPAQAVAPMAPAGAEQAPAPAPPAVIAVMFHADWCRFCRVLEPRFEQLATRLDGQPVLFTEFDTTTDAARTQSAYLAASLGLDDAWQTYGRATGFILLVDAQTKQVIDQLFSDASLDQLAAATEAALSARR